MARPGEAVGASYRPCLDLEPILFQQRINLCFDHAAIPARVVLEVLGRNKEAVPNPIARPEIGAILADRLIKRRHARHDQSRQSSPERHGR